MAGLVSCFPFAVLPSHLPAAESTKGTVPGLVWGGAVQVTKVAVEPGGLSATAPVHAWPLICARCQGCEGKGEEQG